MRSLTQHIHLAVFLLVQLGGAHIAHGFSLIGPFAPWMNTNYFHASGQFGGPMELDKGYRWNCPVVTYGFTPSFIEHFGNQGVAAIDAAAAIINALPPASEIEPTNFPLSTLVANTSTAAPSTQDLKSYALATFLNTMGLGPPLESIFMVHGLFPATNGVSFTNYPVIQRNFDPLTSLPSDAVNSATFIYEFYSNFGFIDAVERQIDPLAVAYTAAGNLGTGLSLTGLTQDDAGGLRHLLHPTNRHIEPLRTDLAGLTTTNLVNVAERGGVNKIQLVRNDTNLISVFQDVYFLNNVPQTQTVTRSLASADILFTVEDIGLKRSDYMSSKGHFPSPVQFAAAKIWTNCASLNGNPGGEGPGVIQPGIQVVFNNLGRYTSLAGTDVFDFPDVFQSINWGLFDGPTNPPVILGAVTNPAAVSLRFDSSRTNGQTVTTWALLGKRDAIYRIESSTNLLNWTNRALLTNLSGILRHSETNNDAQRFFRLNEGPP